MEKIPYPKAVFFIAICEFCERFCFYGMRAVLTLYFRNALKWSEDFSTIIFHLWATLCYFTPLFGATIADSLLGKFRTIFYLSVVYCGGILLLSLAATTQLYLPMVPFSMIALALIAVGTGGIKPCVCALGGDQFVIPGQESQLETFFAVFYFCITSGSFISQLVTPILRAHVSCSPDHTCYPVAFGLPAAINIAALLIFLAGRPMYKIVNPQGNVMFKVAQAVKHSFARRGKEIKAGRKREHWLDYADDKFDKKFLTEAKVLFKILLLYIPLPMFSTLYEQQGSRWTLQATRMTGKMSNSFELEPDQMQVANPMLVLLFIPLFDRVIYPLLGKCNLLKKPLQRISVGLFFAGLSFVFSGIVELMLLPTYAVELAKGESSLNIVNALPVFCELNVKGMSGLEISSEQLLPNDMIIYGSIATKQYDVGFTKTKGCEGLSFNDSYPFVLNSKEATTFVLTVNSSNHSLPIFVKSEEPEDLKKSDNGNPKFRIMYLGFDDVKDFKFQFDGKNSFWVEADPEKQRTHLQIAEPGLYHMSVSHSGSSKEIFFNETFDLKRGGSYLATVVRLNTSDGDRYEVGNHVITSANSVHMLWQLPQLTLMTIGEVMFAVTILDFSYNEAPPSMKSVMQSAWLLTVGFGDLFVVVIAEAKPFAQQYKEFFLYAGLMFVDVLIFSIMAYKYKPTGKFSKDDKPEETYPLIDPNEKDNPDLNKNE